VGFYSNWVTPPADMNGDGIPELVATEGGPYRILGMRRQFSAVPTLSKSTVRTVQP